MNLMNDDANEENIVHHDVYRIKGSKEKKTVPKNFFLLEFRGYRQLIDKLGVLFWLTFFFILCEKATKENMQINFVHSSLDK